jgi:hypothetical protein
MSTVNQKKFYFVTFSLSLLSVLSPVSFAITQSPGEKLVQPPAPPSQSTRARLGEPFAPLQLQSGAPVFARPTIPPLRTTADGRVGIVVKSNTIDFHLLRPESTDVALNGAPFMTGSNGPGALLLPGSNAFTVATSSLFSRSGLQARHMAICNALPDYRQRVRDQPGAYGLFESPTAETSYTGVRQCGANDCYSFKVISSVNISSGVQIWSTPVSVQVSNPKTPNATISAVNIDKARSESVQINAFENILEPMVTADGRLLVGRTGGGVTWSFEGVAKKWDIVYAYTPNPCQVSGWDNFKPIQNAFFDDRVNRRYGFAKYQFRDPSGALVGKYDDMPEAYPWIDRNGTNLFFMALGPQSPLYYGAQSYYPNTPAPGYSTKAIPDHVGTRARGVAVAGLWTHGKKVLLDSVVLNNTDFGMDLNESRLISLYSNKPAMLVGSSRINDLKQVPIIGTYGSGNINISDSLENLFALSTSFQVRTPRDVVWPFSFGKGTDEVAFDDYIDENMFIYSDMNAAFSGDSYLNGFSQNGNFNSNDIRLQNAATSTLPQWNPPSFGVVTGNARIEPVAGGGIKGKGFYLRANAKVAYAYSNSCNGAGRSPCLNRDLANGSDWYAGLAFASTTPASATAATLMTFADGSHVDLSNTRILRFFNATNAFVGEVSIPTTQLNGYGYVHLGLVKQRRGRLTVLINGMPLSQFQNMQGFAMNGGGANSAITLGGDNFSGWIDEFKVVSNRGYVNNAGVMNPMSPEALGFNPELLCNYANGTLFAASSGTLFNTVAAYQSYMATAEVRRLLSKAGQTLPAAQRVACHVNYSDEMGASHRDAITGAYSVRMAVLMPEGQLAVNKPRPDTQNNAFCISCHTTDDTFWRPLSTRALVTSSELAIGQQLNMWQDARRQPMQRPRYIFGTNHPGNTGNLGLPPGYWQKN